MTPFFLIILIHQILFIGMFAVKNIHTRKQVKNHIRGKNKEATLSILFFAFFISVAVFFSLQHHPVGQINIYSLRWAMGLAFFFLGLSLIVSLLSLIHIQDSWRVGIIETQATSLVTSGMYRFTRNPYFVSYLLFFAGYTLLLQNIILACLSLIGFLSIHWMIKKEEVYLKKIHKDNYLAYCKNTPRYLIW